MDSDAEKTETFTIEIDCKKFKFKITFHLSLDGKLIEMTCGLSECKIENVRIATFNNTF